ncbi:MAG: response regulator, partial [Burkholderiales bacterium]|nr:response regulator [Burkholderiales bacterium]
MDASSHPAIEVPAPGAAASAPRRRSIVLDLLLGLVMAVSAVSLVAGLVNYGYLAYQADRLYGAKAAHIQNYLAGAIEQPLWDINDDLIRRIGASVAENDEVAELRVADAAGRTIYEFHSPGSGALIESKTRIIHDGTDVGLLELGVNPQQARQMRSQLLVGNAFTLLLVLAALTLAVRLLVRRRLQEPLAALIEHTRTLAEGHYEAKDRDFGTRELNAIGAGLARLAREVSLREQSLIEGNRQLEAEVSVRRAAESELQDYKNNLERLVRQRTQELERANADLALARDAAEAASRTKSEFMANMSHEIRTPMHAVLGMAEIGLIQQQDERSARLFRQILESGRILLGIIDDILDFSKLNAARIGVEREPVELDRLLDLVSMMSRDRARAKGLELREQRGAGLPPVFFGDFQRLSQVLLNLLSNALKFTDHGAVVLGVERRGAQLVFSVEDSGIGMSEDQVARLFRPFEQVDNSSTRRFGGTGLGLVISKGLVELMGGTISVASRPGAGSRFEVALPLEAAAAASAAAAPESAPDPEAAFAPQRLAGYRVLAVEDNLINRQVLEAMLAIEGAGLVGVESGPQALERLRSAGGAAFDLVLTDIQMPEMDGYELAQRVREIDPGLPVVGVSAHVVPPEAQGWRASGLVARLPKPLDLESLV